MPAGGAALRIAGSKHAGSTSRVNALGAGVSGVGRAVVVPPRSRCAVGRGDLGAGGGQVDRALEGRGVLRAFEAEPAFGRGGRVEHALLGVGERAGQCGDEMRNHGEGRRGATV